MSSACKPSPFSGPFSGPFSSPLRVLVTSCNSIPYLLCGLFKIGFQAH